MSDFPPDAEYFVVNDSCHSYYAFTEHKQEGINEDIFTDPILKQVWKILDNIYAANKKAKEGVVKIRFKGDDRGLIKILFDFHTTRNVDYYRKLLLGK
jgi:hypothetical protein